MRKLVKRKKKRKLEGIVRDSPLWIFPRRSALGFDSSVSGDVAWDHQLWVKLPGDIVERIIARLPLPIQCRIPGLCQKWKEHLFSLPHRSSTVPHYMILSRTGKKLENRELFCHSENQLSDFPSEEFTISLTSKMHPSAGTSKRLEVVLCHFQYAQKSSLTTEKSFFKISAADWKLVDVDGGFLCYQRKIEGSTWLCTNDPLTSLSEIIPPGYSHSQSKSRMLKLLVEQGRLAFKVVVVVDHPYLTAVYNSTASSWRCCNSHPDFASPDLDNNDGGPSCHMNELFVWKNSLYAYSTSEGYSFGNSIVKFNEDSGTWTNVAGKFPSENSDERDRLILSYEDEVMLVQCSRKLPFFSFWKRSDDGTGTTDASFSGWERIVIESNSDTEMWIRSMGCGPLVHAYYGRDYICLTLRGNDSRADGFGTHPCVKYSFANKHWSVVSTGRGKSGKFCQVISLGAER